MAGPVGPAGPYPPVPRAPRETGQPGARRQQSRGPDPPAPERPDPADDHHQQDVQRLRYLLAWNHVLCRAVLRVPTRTPLDAYRRQARERGLDGVFTGSVPDGPLDRKST